MKIQEGGFSFRLSDNVWREVRKQKESILVSYMMVYVQQTWKFQDYTFQLQLKRENETNKIKQTRA